MLNQTKGQALSVWPVEQHSMECLPLSLRPAESMVSLSSESSWSRFDGCCSHGSGSVQIFVLAVKSDMTHLAWSGANSLARPKSISFRTLFSIASCECSTHNKDNGGVRHSISIQVVCICMFHHSAFSYTSLQVRKEAWIQLYLSFCASAIKKLSCESPWWWKWSFRASSHGECTDTSAKTKVWRKTVPGALRQSAKDLEEPRCWCM